MELRYLGFEQLQNARVFRFDIMQKGEATQHAVVTADMSLFLRYRIAIQEGPELCFTKLASDLKQQPAGEHVLTDIDLRAFCDNRAAEVERRMQARKMTVRR